MTNRTATYDDDVWQLVPKEMTSEMLLAWNGGAYPVYWNDAEAREEWRSLLSSAPIFTEETTDEKRHEAVSQILKGE